MNNPKNKLPLTDAKNLARFILQLERRLEKGSREYRDQSFNRSPEELLDEISEELLDVCGWSYVLWTRLQNLRNKISLVDRINPAQADR